MCRYISRIIIWIFVIFALFYVSYNFKIIRVDGESMQPTIRDKQFVVISRNESTYSVDDIVVFGNEQLYIKRIILKGKNNIELKNGKIYCNDILIEPYTAETNIKYDMNETSYFVIGDNYNNSIDSRDYGPIEHNDIIGKVIF